MLLIFSNGYSKASLADTITAQVQNPSDSLACVAIVTMTTPLGVVSSETKTLAADALSAPFSLTPDLTVSSKGIPGTYSFSVEYTFAANPSLDNEVIFTRNIFFDGSNLVTKLFTATVNSLFSSTWKDESSYAVDSTIQARTITVISPPDEDVIPVEVADTLTADLIEGSTYSGYLAVRVSKPDTVTATSELNHVYSFEEFVSLKAEVPGVLPCEYACRYYEMTSKANVKNQKGCLSLADLRRLSIATALVTSYKLLSDCGESTKATNVLQQLNTLLPTNCDC
jgi:hypothetical protein